MTRRRLKPYCLLGVMTLGISVCSISTAALDEYDSAALSECAAYFYLAANAKSMTSFDDYYQAGEFSYNRAIRMIGEQAALAEFNTATRQLNELIDKNWNKFPNAEERFGVRCADLYRAANNPDSTAH